jgi:hypothetical protein
LYLELRYPKMTVLRMLTRAFGRPRITKTNGSASKSSVVLNR